MAFIRPRDMDGAIGWFHAFCIIGIHLTLGLLSIWNDTTAWYDGICATVALLPVAILIVSGRCRPLKLRTVVTSVCITAAVCCQELAREPGTERWFPLTRPVYMGAIVGVAYWLKGASTYIKLWPSIKVMTDMDPLRQADWPDYAGWVMSLLSDVYFIQEPHIYRNAQARIEWRSKFAQIETFHLAGLALSASAQCNRLEMIWLLLSVMQPILSLYVYEEAVRLYGTQ